MHNPDLAMRYISLGKFIELLDSKTLHLGRIDRLEDKTEGEWYAHLVKAASKAFNGWDDELPEKIRSIKKRSYISAWFSADYLSIAMWKLYGITDEGIAIRVRKDKLKKIKQVNENYLKELQADIFFGDVIYVEDDPSEMKRIAQEQAQNKDWIKFRNILLKHKAYKFEEEYRILVMLPEGYESYQQGIKLQVGDDLNSFIDSIFLNPMIHSDHWYIRVVEKILDCFGIERDKLKLGEIKTDIP